MQSNLGCTPCRTWCTQSAAPIRWHHWLQAAPRWRQLCEGCSTVCLQCAVLLGGRARECLRLPTAAVVDPVVEVATGLKQAAKCCPRVDDVQRRHPRSLAALSGRAGAVRQSDMVSRGRLCCEAPWRGAAGMHAQGGPKPRTYADAVAVPF